MIRKAPFASLVNGAFALYGPMLCDEQGGYVVESLLSFDELLTKVDGSNNLRFISKTINKKLDLSQGFFILMPKTGT